MSDHVSDLRWDRLLAGELPEDQTTEVRAHAASCERCSARLNELTAGRDAFTVRPQVIAFGRRKRGVWIGAAAMVAAAAAVLIVVSRPRDPDPGNRTKGQGPELELVLVRGTELVPVSSRDVVFTGDVLQAAYSSKRDGYGAVLARDGAGGVFAYVPSSSDLMIALPAGDRRSFSESTRLDDVVGAERIAIVWCEQPHALGPLLAELRTTGDVAAPDGCHLRRIDLTKKLRP